MSTDDLKDKLRRAAPRKPRSPTVRVRGDRGFDPPGRDHSPLPWFKGQGGDNTLRLYSRTGDASKVICQFGEGIDEDQRQHKNAHANARFIVAACNNVERLADAAGDAADWLIEAPEGSDQWERGTALLAAIAQFKLDRLQTPSERGEE